MVDISKIDFNKERENAEQNIQDSLHVLRNFGDKQEVPITAHPHKSGSVHITLNLRSSLLKAIYTDKKKILKEYVKGKESLLAIKINGGIILVPVDNA
jgi:hypothetical protein